MSGVFHWLWLILLPTEILSDPAKDTLLTCGTDVFQSRQSRSLNGMLVKRPQGWGKRAKYITVAAQPEEL